MSLAGFSCLRKPSTGSTVSFSTNPVQYTYGGRPVVVLVNIRRNANKERIDNHRRRPNTILLAHPNTREGMDRDQLTSKELATITKIIRIIKYGPSSPTRRKIHPIVG